MSEMTLRGLGPVARGTAVFSLASALLSIPADSRGEVTELTLFQRCGRSPWVIVGEVEDSDDRLAAIRVIEVLKGEYGRPSLRVVYRLENWLREGWEDKIAFPPGEKVVLFLQRYDPEKTEGEGVPKKLAAEDVFASTLGAMGVLPMPSEGQEAILDALRTFARVSAIQDPVLQEEAVLEMIGSSNPEISRAGLEQTYARRLALPRHVPVLLRISEEGREPERIEALRILGQVAEDLRAAEASLPDQGSVADRLRARVLGREEDALRAEALKVIVTMGGAAEREFLRMVSRGDRSQMVRYEASRALLDMGD